MHNTQKERKPRSFYCLSITVGIRIFTEKSYKKIIEILKNIIKKSCIIPKILN